MAVFSVIALWMQRLSFLTDRNAIAVYIIDAIEALRASSSLSFRFEGGEIHALNESDTGRPFDHQHHQHHRRSASFTRAARPIKQYWPDCHHRHHHRHRHRHRLCRAPAPRAPPKQRSSTIASKRRLLLASSLRTPKPTLSAITGTVFFLPANRADKTARRLASTELVPRRRRQTNSAVVSNGDHRSSPRTSYSKREKQAFSFRLGDHTTASASPQPSFFSLLFFIGNNGHRATLTPQPSQPSLLPAWCRYIASQRHPIPFFLATNFLP